MDVFTVVVGSNDPSEVNAIPHTPLPANKTSEVCHATLEWMRRHLSTSPYLA